MEYINKDGRIYLNKDNTKDRDRIMDTTNINNTRCELIPSDVLHKYYSNLYNEFISGMFMNVDMSKMSLSDKRLLMKKNNKIRRNFSDCMYDYAECSLLKFRVRKIFKEAKNSNISQFIFTHYVNSKTYIFCDIDINIKYGNTLLKDDESIKIINVNLECNKKHVYNPLLPVKLATLENVQCLLLLENDENKKTEYLYKISFEKHYKPLFFKILKSLEYKNALINDLKLDIHSEIFKKYKFKASNDYNDIIIDDNYEQYCIIMK